jgi:hypothetical protein
MMWTLHLKTGSSPNYLQPSPIGFDRIPFVNIALYKAILKMWYPHPKVDHTNEKQTNFITTNYAFNILKLLNFFFKWVKELVLEFKVNEPNK